MCVIIVISKPEILMDGNKSTDFKQSIQLLLVWCTLNETIYSQKCHGLVLKRQKEVRLAISHDARNRDGHEPGPVDRERRPRPDPLPRDAPGIVPEFQLEDRVQVFAAGRVHSANEEDPAAIRWGHKLASLNVDLIDRPPDIPGILLLPPYVGCGGRSKIAIFNLSNNVEDVVSLDKSTKSFSSSTGQFRTLLKDLVPDIVKQSLVRTMTWKQSVLLTYLFTYENEKVSKDIWLYVDVTRLKVLVPINS